MFQKLKQIDSNYLMNSDIATLENLDELENSLSLPYSTPQIYLFLSIYKIIADIPSES